MATPSQFDNETFDAARNHINNFIRTTANELLLAQDSSILEIGPQKECVVRNSFVLHRVDTLDIVDTYNPTYVGDITQYNPSIKDSSYDVICCLEVLEHTINPFNAVEEIRRILKHGGYALFSAPLNWRIHGPVPDCWRFTEFGWRVLLKDFDILKIDTLETPGRELFPIKYNILAKCDKYKSVNANTMKFDLIK